MIWKVEKYQTEDFKVFDTLKEAEEWETKREFLKVIDKFLGSTIHQDDPDATMLFDVIGDIIFENKYKLYEILKKFVEKDEKTK
jgi:tRNA U54 and U55 pseudouridine synthase Pus10